MDQHTIRGTIRRFLMNACKISSEEELSDADSLVESGFVNSMVMLDLIRFIENEFEISIEDRDVTPENFDTVRDLVRFVSDKLDPSE